MTFPVPTLASRLRGALLAHATIDALGGPVEFKRRHTFPLVTTMQANDNFGLPAGCFTDDTSMALCLAHSLLSSSSSRPGNCGNDDDDNSDDGKVASDLLDQARRYVRWYRDGYCSSVGWCFDIGVGTRGALGCWGEVLNASLSSSSSLAADEVASHREKDKQMEREGLAQIEQRWGGEQNCGNGSLMRVLPVALFCETDEEAERVARESGRVTHPHPRCGLSCVLFVRLVRMALKEKSKGEMADALAAWVGELKTRGDDQALSDPSFVERFGAYANLGDWGRRTEDRISSSGYVLDSLEAALWAFFTTSTLRDGAIKAVNLGDDADTVGAIYGGLAGAFYGEEAIPQDWLAAMRSLEMVTEVAERIAKVRTGGEA